MKVTVTFRHMDPDDDVRDYVEEKISKLAGKYFQRPQEAQVVLDAEKFRRHAEITLKADNTTLVGKEEMEDMKAAVDSVIDKLEAQAKKHREKYKSRKKSGGSQGAFAVYHGEPSEPPEENAEPEVIRMDTFVPKPYTVEDAVMLLDDSRKDDFFVFRNADTLEICVLFRRPDGNYGLIETEGSSD